MADADIPPASSNPDDWHTAINLLTGFTLPARGIVFRDLYGNNDIPLMKVEIHDSSATPSNAELDAIYGLSWRTENSGWRIQNTDFTVPFYSGMDGAVGGLPIGSEVKMRKARITLLGTDTAHNVPAGGVDMGSKFGAGSNMMPDGFKGWDSTTLSQYSYGGGLALEQLLNPPYTTQAWGLNGNNVDRLNAVDVNTFELAADAFDRAALFFAMSRQTIQNWEDQLGSEDAAWRGQAAGVFWDIVH
ncbi:MAG: cell surface protein, partial [Streptosporangiaceae bacterium]|nr:cell surface protein [Streptosporangiaceae bacterium]